MLVRSTLCAVVLFATTSLLNSNSVSAQTNSQRDAVLGGVAGAIIGGVVGNQNDETPEGIAIGGVAGAIAGHVLGSAKDRNDREQYYYQQQAARAAQQRQVNEAVQLQKAVSVHDAISLSNSGVSPQLIINQIQTNGIQQEIGVSEIINLHQNGVSEIVIHEMQQASIGGGASYGTTSVVDHGPPVIVDRGPIVVSRPSPTIVVKPGIVVKPSRSNVYRSHRGYHPHHGPHRSARGHGFYIR